MPLVQEPETYFPKDSTASSVKIYSHYGVNFPCTKVFEAPGVESVLPAETSGHRYAETRACFRSGEIRVLDASGKLERTIAFNETDRKL